VEKPRKHGAFPSESHVIMAVANANHDAEERTTQRVMVKKRDRGPGRIVFRADDPTLTPYAGLAISGELVRGLSLIERAEAELRAVKRARPIKQRARGLSAGQLAVAIAEAQIATARQLAYRFRRSHIQALERAQADAGAQLDRKLGRDACEEVTLDLDGSETVVYGTHKEGSGRSRHGHRA
jgi:hypothetical protein